jgi:hypothetical protein
MTSLGSSDPIIVSRESAESADPQAIVQCNVDVVNALRKALLLPEEISQDAWLSYYVDYYLAQVQNGGFSQFVYNSKWADRVIVLVTEGLVSMGAKRHFALFKEGASLVNSFGTRIRAFFSSDYFGTNAGRDRLDGITNRFYEVDRVEGLLGLNANWLKSHPNLKLLPEQELRGAVERRASLIPDLAQREALARSNEPVWLRNIRALCALSGQSLVRLNAGTGQAYEGKTVFAHHFSTDRGHHYMIEVDGKALLFNGTTNVRVAELPLHQPGGVA